MTEILPAITPLFWCIVFFVGFSALVYGLTQLAEKYWQMSSQWRRIWLSTVAFCWLPLVLFVLPALPVVDAVIVLPALLDGGMNNPPTGYLATERPSSMSTAILFIWLLMVGLAMGGLVKMLALLVQILRVRNQAKKSSTVFTYADFSKPQQRYFRRLQQQLKLEILISNDSISPYVFGLWRPRLVLTADVIKTLPMSALQLIIRHEWTHIQRRDYAWVLLVQLSACIAWFNPFYLAIVNRFLWAAELSCDLVVLQKKPRQNHLYAKALVDVLSLVSRHQQKQFTAFAHHQKRNIRMRISTILQCSGTNKLSVSQRLIALGSLLGLTTLAVLVQPVAVIAEETALVRFQNPVPEARVSSSFGQKADRFHNGIDLAIGLGSTVVASAGGKVLVSTDVYGNKVNYGKIIIIEHANGLRSLYSHLDSRTVSKGDQVAAGELIGTVGETGKVTGPHLHFEILDGDNRLDPQRFIGQPAQTTYSRLVM